MFSNRDVFIVRFIRINFDEKKISPLLSTHRGILKSRSIMLSNISRPSLSWKISTIEDNPSVRTHVRVADSTQRMDDYRGNIGESWAFVSIRVSLAP